MRKKLTSLAMAGALCLGVASAAMAVGTTQTPKTLTAKEQIAVLESGGKLDNVNLATIYGFSHGSVTGTGYQGFFALSGANGKNLHFWVQNKASEPAVMRIQTPSGEVKQEIPAGQQGILSLPLDTKEFVDYHFDVNSGASVSTDINVEYRIVQSDAQTYEFGSLDSSTNPSVSKK